MHLPPSGPAPSTAVGTMNGSETWTERESEGGRGKVCAPRNKREITNQTAQGRGMETTTVPEADTGTENVTERDPPSATEREIETGTVIKRGRRRGRKTVTATDIEKEIIGKFVQNYRCN